MRKHESWRESTPALDFSRTELTLALVTLPHDAGAHCQSRDWAIIASSWPHHCPVRAGTARGSLSKVCYVLPRQAAHVRGRQSSVIQARSSASELMHQPALAADRPSFHHTAAQPGLQHSRSSNMRVAAPYKRTAATGSDAWCVRAIKCRHTWPYTKTASDTAALHL